MHLKPIFAAILLMASGGPAIGAPPSEELMALREQDVRLTAIAERMQAANAQLCNQLMPLTGMVLHSADQYQQGDHGWFANGNVAVLGVVPQSAAALQGVQEGDGLAKIADSLVSEIPENEGFPRRDDAFEHIANLTTRSNLPITLQRGEDLLEIDLAVQTGCRTLVEILTDNGRTARSDGRVIQISYGLADRMSDEQLAVIFAHELAHTVLEHKRRLADAGVEDGIFRELGRNRRLARAAEVEADLLSAHLLKNAGYDPRIAADFWRSDVGGSLAGGVFGGLFRSSIYPSRKRRAELIETEIATYLGDPSGLSLAEHLISMRDQPFSD